MAKSNLAEWRRIKKHFADETAKIDLQRYLQTREARYLKSGARIQLPTRAGRNRESPAAYTGDERALSDEDKKQINQREQWPPSNDEIIRIIMDDIRRKTECGINDYFNRQN